MKNAGLAHYLSTSSVVHLYGCDAPPTWSYDAKTESDLIHHGKGGFSCRKPAGIDHRPLPESTAERAFIEILLEVIDEQEFRTVDKLFESAVRLRPRVVQSVLEASQSVKAKGLVCGYAERHRHAWFGLITMTTIDLGRGKRQLVAPGTPQQPVSDYRPGRHGERG